MPLTIMLQRTAADRAAARIGDEPLAAFEPRALLVDQPLHSERPLPADPFAYGQRLFAALGGDALRAAIAALPRAPHMDSLIAIQSDDADLLAIPWEYLHDGDDFLIFKYLFARVVPGAPLPAPFDPALPWRLLAQGSDPPLQEVRDPDTGRLAGHAPVEPRLQVVQELDLIRDDLKAQQPPAPIRWQRVAPTRAALIDNLASPEPVLFHYTGHGAVRDGQPLLCFDDGCGCMDPQAVRNLAADLRGSVCFAFLNACRTADSAEPGANLALALVREGVPTVLGTQYSVLDESASLFARTFYRWLAAGQHPAHALYRARHKLRDQFRSEPREWAVPVLYLAAGYTWQPQRPQLHAPLPPIEPSLNIAALRAPERFFGREHELYALAKRFMLDRAQIVTMRGTGGIGKTALSGELARRLRFYFADGIYALTLAPTGDEFRLSAATLRRALAELLGVQSRAFENPDAAQEQEAALAHAVTGKRRMLLIWDNYETVLWRLGREEESGEQLAFDADERNEAEAVQRLARRLAENGAHLLFTTRQSPVGLPGETYYPEAAPGRQQQLGGLDARSSEQLMRARVGQRVPSEAFLQQIAAEVQHSPLALQLAAARWSRGRDDEKTFLAQLSEELLKADDEGLPEHQRGVIVNVRLSVNALPAEAQRDLLALTVIANLIIVPQHGAVVWGLMEQTEESIRYHDDQAHARLEQLSDASLLQAQGYDEEHNWAQAYSFQPVVAQVLRGMAHDDALIEPRARYARWADMLVSRAYGEGGIGYDAEVASSTQFFLPDLPSALALLPDEQRGWAAWRAATSFRHFGQPDQAAQMLQLAEETAQQTDNQELFSRVYHERATALDTRGDLDGAMALYQQSLALDEALGDVRGTSATLHQMAGVLVTRGDLDGAMALYQQSLEMKEALGDVRGTSATLHQMAGVLVTRGDLDGAMGLYEQSLEMKEALGDVRGTSATLHEMAGVLVTRGDLDGAMGLYQQAQDIDEALGDVRGTSATLHQMAGVLDTRGDLDGAMRLYEQSLAIKESLGNVRGTSATLHQMAGVLVTRGDLDGAMGLYQQSLEMKEALGDVRGTSATLHEMAGVLVTRGDLDGAMALYQQSLALHEALGDVRGKSATLANMAVVQFRQGARETALRNARESLRLLRGMGATRDAAQVEQIVVQMEAALAGTSELHTMSPVRLASALIAATTRALRGDIPRDGARAELTQLHVEEPLHALVAALLSILDSNAGATNDLRDAVHALVDGASEREELVQLSVALFNLAGQLGEAGQHAAAVPLLYQVVALDEKTDHPDLESDRAALEAMRARASGQPEPGLREAVAAWQQAGRDENEFAVLLNAICNLFVAAMRDGSPEQRWALAADLALARAARPLPVAGANDFLHVLQLQLRGQPGMLQRADQLAAGLPVPLREALETMERIVRGEAEETAGDSETADDAQLAAMLDAMPPEQRAQLAVIGQIAPILQQAVDVLRHRAATAAERARHAERLEHAVAQVATLATEQPDAPWPDAAAALRAVAAWLRDAPTDPSALPAPYDQVVGGMLEEPDDADER